ncbi:hypothetical protein [Lacipirellula sp.]|uniref:hypothetical protein n=1 Tax=Lacipirellula sp. TaxID=2691419 RepID=UPI003D0AD963
MKNNVAIALIIMGTMLVMAPAVSDFLYQLNVVTVLSQAKSESVTLQGQMGDYYRFACWATGAGMIAAATYCSLFRKEPCVATA